MFFTGFDSAWGGRNKGALCDLETTSKPGVLRAQAHGDVAWGNAPRLIVREDETHVVAIDQGLVVRKARGCRPVEADLARALMKSFRVGAHSSNTTNPCYGENAGIWTLTEALDASGYRQNPMAVSRREPGRWYFECYPHPAWLGLFGLPSLLLYKVRKKNAAGWRVAVESVRSLANASPSIENIQDLVPADMPPTKANEDLLDAIISAYVAAVWWESGTERSACFGDLESGYVVTPVSAATREPLELVFEGRINCEGCATSQRPGAVGAVSAPPTPAARATGSDPTQPPGASVSLVCTDTTNLWANANGWMNPTDSRELAVTFPTEDGAPVVRFIPFATSSAAGGKTGHGLKPHPEDRAEWMLLAEGASKTTPVTYDVIFRYG